MKTEIETDMPDDDDDFELPDSWQGKMEAIVAGAVDYDNIEPLAMECAEIADKAIQATAAKRKEDAKLRKMIDITPPWSWCMSRMIASLLARRGGELTGEQQEINESVVKCGKVADAYLAGQFDAV